MAKQHGCPEPLVGSIALEGKRDHERFESLKWGLRTWDHWYFNDADQRFGDDWHERIPAQLAAYTLFYFTREGDLVFDPTCPPSRAQVSRAGGRWRSCSGHLFGVSSKMLEFLHG